MRGNRTDSSPARWRSWCAGLAIVLPGIARCQTAAADGDFIYRARPGDTLIGISRRLLLEPRRWPQIQTLNRIVNPRRIPQGSAVRIPYAWLKMTVEAATVLTVSGEAHEGGGNVTRGQTLAEGSQIQTGADGSVTLVLADGSTITLQKSTTLSLDEMRQVTGVPAAHDTRLKLQSGHVQTVVKPQGNVGRFEIQTPVAVSAVRGTEFRDGFDPQDDHGTTETLAGTVAVSGSAATVAVPANFGTRVERGSAPLPARELLAPPDLRAFPGTNSSSQLHLQWPAVAGAAGYRLQVAPDVDFHSILVELQSAAPRGDLPALADGSYWLRVRSIDELGLEGPDAARPFVQHRLSAPPTPTAPLAQTSVWADGVSLAWTGSEPAARYRVQIGRDADFRDTLLERDVEAGSSLDIDRISPGRYFWRVAGIDQAGEAGEWSPAQPYTQQPAASTAQAPSYAGHDMHLHWEPHEGLRYRIQVARNPDFRSPLLDRTVEAPEVSMRRPRAGVYYARIQMIAEDGSSSPFGKTSRFEVPLPRWVKILLPLLTLLTFVR